MKVTYSRKVQFKVNHSFNVPSLRTFTSIINIMLKLRYLLMCYGTVGMQKWSAKDAVYLAI